MEIKRLDINKWAFCGDYMRKMVEWDTNLRTSWYVRKENFKIEDLSPLTYDWFNVFGIPELTNLTLLVPNVNLSDIASDCGDTLNLHGQNDFAFFTEWFFDKVIKLHEYGFYLYYGKKYSARGAADIIDKYNSWGASFPCPTNLLAHAEFVLYIEGQKLFENYWSEDVRRALIDNNPFGVKYQFKKLDKIKDAVSFAAELLNIKAKYYNYE